MRAEMAPPSRGSSARVAPLSSRWQRGAGLLQTRITRVMGHSVPSAHCRTEASRVVRNLARTDSRLYLLVPCDLRAACAASDCQRGDWQPGDL